MSILSELKPPEGARHKERRVGRGPGSGVGKMSGRGFKGQKARQPGNLGKLNFQGGQTPIQRRLPKRGFRIPFPVKNVALNVSVLERFDAQSEIGERELREARLVQGRVDKIKILGNGDISKPLTVSAHEFSQSARLKIEAAGGKVVVLAPPAEAEAAPAGAES